MTIERELFTTSEMIGVLRGTPVETPVFWRRWYPSVVQSTREFIEFSKIWGRKRLAPLVVPTAQGRPIYGSAEEMDQFKPAYVKPKDAVHPERVIRRFPGLGEIGQDQPMTPNERHDAIVADILREHSETIDRREEWMAAEALINGTITLEDDAFPRTVISFRREADLTVVLAGGARWGQANVEPFNDIQAWALRMAGKKFGGMPTDCLMGPGAWEEFSKSRKVLELMNTQIRQTDGTSMNFGLRGEDDAQLMGSLSNRLNIWVYTGNYEAPDGTTQEYLPTNSLLLINGNVRGVRAYGAILDKKAEFQALPRFPKMWDENDPAGTVIMTQAAPLMIPVNPNNTLKATVK